MIKRYYFMAYKTGMLNGGFQEGCRVRLFVSWLPRPIDVFKQMAAEVEKGIGQPVSATSFHRVR